MTPDEKGPTSGASGDSLPCRAGPGRATRMNPRGTADRHDFRAARSTTSLVIIALAMGVALAVVLAGAVWLIAGALHHASTS